MNKLYPLLLEHRLPVVVRYCISTAIMLVCSVMQIALQMLSGYPGYFLLLPGIFLSGLVFDRGTGIFSALIAVCVGGYLSLRPESVEYLSTNGLFLVTAAGTAAVAEFLRSEMKRVMLADRAKALLLQEMALRQQAEKSSRLKDEFLATVSHELRTPLNSILGWGQLLNTGALSEAERQNALDTIYRNARSQSQLIDDLLDMSRLITGTLRLDLLPTVAETVVEAAIDTVRPHAEAKNISIATHFAAQTPQITVDPPRLQQMVGNLLVNAVKFTPEGGKVDVILEQAGEDLEITVRDNGFGIDPEFLPHVFDRFRQGDSSSTREHRGLGLGLAIVTNLAHQHGGRARVASEGRGKGAAFTISLPLKRAERGSFFSLQALQQRLR